MPLPIEYSEKTRGDVRSISIWYRDKKYGLDDEFLLSLEATAKSIARNPFFYKTVHRTIRCASLKRFPYKVYFVVGSHSLTILGVFHTRRSPQTILNRFEKE